MKRQILHTVEGVRDLHPTVTAKKNTIETNIMGLFNQYGYEQVQTPTFEYYNIYHNERNGDAVKNLYKFFNREGDILALRPDITPSVARYTATFYGHETTPKRFAYLGNVFYNNENYQGKLREYTQAGVECIGLAGEETDAEIIAMAVNALLSTGLREFQVDIGHAGFFNGLAEEAGFTEELANEARKLIDEKNYIALDELLTEENISDNVKEGLLLLPTLFGQEEVLEKAKKVTTNPVSLQAIERVKTVYEILKEYGLDQYISFDLGMVSQINYYTGVIFKGYTYEVGDSVVDGGRYDTLLKTFDYDTPAIGFAVRIDELLDALTRQEIPIDIPTINTIVMFENGFRKTAIELAETLRRQGMTVELCFSATDVDDTIAYGESKNIGGLMHLIDGDTIELIDLKTKDKNTVKLSDLMNGGN